MKLHAIPLRGTSVHLASCGAQGKANEKLTKHQREPWAGGGCRRQLVGPQGQLVAEDDGSWASTAVQALDECQHIGTQHIVVVPALE